MDGKLSKVKHISRWVEIVTWKLIWDEKTE